MSRLVRVAVVGAGPAGFYAAGHLLQHAFEVDMYDRLPTPWGLVRSGVAPDHPKIKSVTRVFEQTAAQPGFRFFGNVEVGRDVDPVALASWYDAVVWAVGAQSDRRSGIPGEHLAGSAPAGAFVGWYNGHPDFRGARFDLSGERAIVIGNGNVALDVARMLTLPHEALAVTDIADHALAALRDSAIREVVVLGRRGPEHAAFTAPELLELGELSDVVVDPRDLAAAGSAVGLNARRNLEILEEYARRPPTEARRRIVLRFETSPVEIFGRDRVEAVNVVRNDRVETIPAGLVLRAIGYAGTPLPGIPFDPVRGVIPHERGRVAGHRGAYVTGWIKRGPSGVIGTNKKCARETVGALLEDIEAGRLDLTVARPTAAEVLERLPPHVGYSGWQAIDRHERGLGARAGRPRVKLTRIPELLGAATRASTT